ncbi:MAG: hypothetical protein R3B06_15280 [Kofleriaceae bacterium]
MRFIILASTLLVSLPLLGGAQGDGCAANSRSPAPDVTGWWDVTYDDTIAVEINLGGSVYTSQLGPQGGVVEITHDGRPFRFDLDCSRPEVLCPSEAWPTAVLAEQREAAFEHRMVVTLPTQRCTGALARPAAGTCGVGTNNPDCDDVCTGDVVTEARETFGVIGERGDSFRLYLGAGMASNGFNCAVLGWSVADAALATEGSAAAGDWTALRMDAGLVTLGYAGGCLWAGDPNMDGQLEALVAAASIKFTTGFVADRR